MGLDDRLIWLLVGVAIGFFMGYITRLVREIKEETHEVNVTLKDQRPRQKDEGGHISPKFLSSLALFLVVLLSASAAFMSQKASNELAKTQDELVLTQKRLDRVVECNQNVLGEALDVLNTRSTFTRTQASSNLALQKAQAIMFKILLHIPPYTRDIRAAATNEYNDKLNDFIEAGTKAEANAIVSEYPEAEELTKCVAESTVTPKE